MRMTVKTAAVTALAALALAGCGSAAATAPASPAPAVSASATAPASWPSARAIAEQVGAAGITAETPGLYASDEVSATWHGRLVSVVTFASGQLRDNWVKVAEQFTPVMSEGPQWAIADLGPAA
jgi:hypothetical protein